MKHDQHPQRRASRRAMATAGVGSTASHLRLCARLEPAPEDEARRGAALDAGCRGTCGEAPDLGAAPGPAGDGLCFTKK
jgi:hypothetical protein